LLVARGLPALVYKPLATRTQTAAAALLQATSLSFLMAEAEVGCDECFDVLDRYVELELAGADADAAIPGLRAHLAGCPACREEHGSLRARIGGEQVL